MFTRQKGQKKIRNRIWEKDHGEASAWSFLLSAKKYKIPDIQKREDDVI